MMLIVLMEFDVLGIPELHSKFNKYLALQVQNEFDSLLVCNII